MSENKNFKAGDVVQLKSGGPKMTFVKLLLDDKHLPGYCTCSWFCEGEDKYKHESFKTETLCAVEPKQEQE